MKNISGLFRFGATGVVALLLVVGSALWAQTAEENPPKHSPVHENVKNQDELSENYRQLKEQLRAAEQAIINNRLEAEAAASTRTAAITEKLDTLRQTVMNERERQQNESQRTAYERIQQQTMTQDLTRIVVFFGGAGMLVLCAIALLHWRGNQRMADYCAQLRSLPFADRQGLLPVGNDTLGHESVTLANQRLASMLDRMEQRVLELEHTVVPPTQNTTDEGAENAYPAPSTTDEGVSAAPGSPTPTAIDEGENVYDVPSSPTINEASLARIAALLAQGQALLNAKKSTEALACYDEILGLDANHAEALLKKGYALERLQHRDQALNFYDRAIQADQNLALAYIAKGGLCVRLERFDEALECYEQARHAGKMSMPRGVVGVSISDDWSAR